MKLLRAPVATLLRGYRECLLAGVSFTVAACAVSTSVQKIGPDTYTVSAIASPARGGSSGARNLALAAANEYCSKAGKEILVTNFSESQINNAGRGNSDITFRCLLPADPELSTRPTYSKEPDVVVKSE